MGAGALWDFALRRLRGAGHSEGEVASPSHRVPPGSPDELSLSPPSSVLTVQPPHMWVLSAEAILADSLLFFPCHCGRMPTVRTDLDMSRSTR